ncbi:hypothetical protein [Lysinibacillus sp. Y5S-8]|uniref:hypothetical protein n=1 Tax=Lysinibacillus sp. Y5S-8 TaxID=3122488 RepID=UPI0030D60578
MKKHQNWNDKYYAHRILSEDCWNSFLKRISRAMTMNNHNELIKKNDDIIKFTNSITKEAIDEYLKQAVVKSWLDKFDNGIMAGGDFERLKIIIKQRSSCPEIKYYSFVKISF